MSNPLIRRRHTNNNNTNSNSNTNSNTTIMSMNTIRRNSGGKLTSSLLLQSSPSHHSKVYKLKVPMSYSLFPLWFTKFLYYTCLPLSLCVNCFQRTVSSNLEDNERCSRINNRITCTNTWFQPFWNERYLIAIGSYLYKFQPNSTTTTPINITSASTNTTSINTTHTIQNTADKMTIKGSPLPLDQLSMSLTSQTQFGIIDHHHHHHHHQLLVEEISQPHQPLKQKKPKRRNNHLH
mmetsp:Transcript_19124/g.23534  ORF Transcript_19124/g.23534 Transcript_19124/m.23534 type:complete len:236 (+) Transcript_19124:95-802(+)